MFSAFASDSVTDDRSVMSGSKTAADHETGIAGRGMYPNRFKCGGLCTEAG